MSTILHVYSSIHIPCTNLGCDCIQIERSKQPNSYCGNVFGVYMSTVTLAISLQMEIMVGHHDNDHVHCQTTDDRP